MSGIFRKTSYLVICWAAVAIAQDPVIVWEVQAYSSGVNVISYSADSQIIATGSGLSNSPVKIWSAENGSLLQSFDLIHDGVLSVDLSSDGQYLAAGYIASSNPPVGWTKIWEISSQTVVNEFGGAYAAFSPDGSRIATGGGAFDDTLRLHDVFTGHQIFSVLNEMFFTSTPITCLVFSPEDDFIVTGGADRRLRLFDAQDGDCLSEFPHPPWFTDFNTIAYSSYPNLRIATSPVSMWTYQLGGTLLHMYTLESSGRIHDLDFSPTGQYLISSGRESPVPLSQWIKIWRINDLELMVEYQEYALSIEYSPDNLYFAYGTVHGDLKLAENPMASVPFVYLNLTPTNPPIIIPAGGGNLNFTFYFQNYSPDALDLDIWLEIAYEGGTPITVVQRSFNNFPPYHFIHRDDLRFPIPASYAAGEYTFTGKGGEHPDVVWCVDDFTFVKEGTDNIAGFVPFPVDGAPNTFDQIDMSCADLPSDYAVLGSYPNPFNPSTTISFSLPEPERVSLNVFDVSGRLVAELVDGWRNAGDHEVIFKASNLSSGIYIYNLSAGHFTASGKIVLMK